jgi:hypothetical protein
VVKTAPQYGQTTRDSTSRSIAESNHKAGGEDRVFFVEICTRRKRLDQVSKPSGVASKRPSKKSHTGYPAESTQNVNRGSAGASPCQSFAYQVAVSLFFVDVPGAWFALFDVARRGDRDKRAAFKRSGLTECDIRHFARLTFEREVFA